MNKVLMYFRDFCVKHQIPMDSIELVIRGDNETIKRVRPAIFYEFDVTTHAYRRADPVDSVRIMDILVSFERTDDRK